jgi:acetylornithine deacetylase/succinyl-diaminopimelate desuccinylase-like protein
MAGTLGSRAMADPLLDDLLDWLRIPSISTGGGDPAQIARAADWVCERVEAAGGTARAVTEFGGNPIAYGELRANRDDAPTVLIYGHYDVQAVGDPGAWVTDPFDPQIRDGRIYARGASDDKGNFLPLLHVACDLARAGELPVHVRVLVEGEEEAGGQAVVDWLRADEQGADAAIVFDSGMVDERTPAITVGLRGMVMADITVTTGRRDLHSGMYGGSSLNAVHALHSALGAVLPGPDGRLRDELRAGIEPPADDERASWATLKPGDEVIAEVGGVPIDANAGRDYYERNGADASLDVNFLAAGEPRTVLPATARAAVSIRLAPRQDPDAIAATFERLLRDALPAGAEMTWDDHRASPALFRVDSPVMLAAREAIERATGAAPALVRSGGSIPIVAEFAAKGIETIVGGYGLPDDDIHAPNESFRLESLRLGEASARELYTSLARLRPEHR